MINPLSATHSTPPQAGGPPAQGGYGERLAIWTLRRIAEGPGPCLLSRGEASSSGPPHDDLRQADISWGPGQDLRKVAAAVRVALDEMGRQGAGRLRLGCPGSLALTRHERGLLRALAAAQSGDEERVDNCLYKIALDRQVRRHLATAVTMLAAALAAAGHWLADAAPAWPLPAPALPVAKLHGRPLRSGEVAWP
ncbi:MAG TPA: hypothetical protein VG848_04565 [Acetobacteraceae bacterium]|jgi:hypothetical protein|nr:hypothetical protein [Acetobacteraceae bacterium]